MDKKNLHDEFTKFLYEKIPNKKELVNVISNVLRIEKEPASRRLNGKVLFSVQEVGLLAEELGILLDSLLRSDERYQWIPFLLKSPMSADSLHELCDVMDTNFDEMYQIAREKADYGGIFHHLPMEMYIYHPHLMKYMFFKWGHYFVGTEEFNDFSKWKLPERVAKFKDKIKLINEKIDYTLYIWDESLIWILVKEINYLHQMLIINTQDKEFIKDDLKCLLTRLEKYLKGNFIPEVGYKNIEFYVSHVNVGFSSQYLFSERKQLVSLQTSFSFSLNDKSYESFVNIKKWIDSFKNISVLISGSGNLERRSFFKRQHQIIDLFL